MSLLQMPFSLIKRTPYDILRRTRDVTPPDGFYTPPEPEIVPILALIYPMSRRDIVQVLPEGLRKRKVIRVFSNVELKEHIDGSLFEADEIEYAGESYRVFKLGAWIDVSNFSGYDAYAVRAEVKELSDMGS